jgi:transposase
LGIDLAKNVYELHGVDPRGVTVLRRKLRCAQLSRLLAQLPPCPVAMKVPKK